MEYEEIVAQWLLCDPALLGGALKRTEDMEFDSGAELCQWVVGLLYEEWDGSGTPAQDFDGLRALDADLVSAEELCERVPFRALLHLEWEHVCTRVADTAEPSARFELEPMGPLGTAYNYARGRASLISRTLARKGVQRYQPGRGGELTVPGFRVQMSSESTASVSWCRGRKKSDRTPNTIARDWEDHLRACAALLEAEGFHVRALTSTNGERELLVTRKEWA